MTIKEATQEDFQELLSRVTKMKEQLSAQAKLDSAGFTLENVNSYVDSAELGIRPNRLNSIREKLLELKELQLSAGAFKALGFTEKDLESNADIFSHVFFAFKDIAPTVKLVQHNFSSDIRTPTGRISTKSTLRGMTALTMLDGWKQMVSLAMRVAGGQIENLADEKYRILAVRAIMSVVKYRAEVVELFYLGQPIVENKHISIPMNLSDSSLWHRETREDMFEGVKATVTDGRWSRASVWGQRTSGNSVLEELVDHVESGILSGELCKFPVISGLSQDTRQLAQSMAGEILSVFSHEEDKDGLKQFLRELLVDWL